jgi:hypothetical protein
MLYSATPAVEGVQFNCTSIAAAFPTNKSSTKTLAMGCNNLRISGFSELKVVDRRAETLDPRKGARVGRGRRARQQQAVYGTDQRIANDLKLDHRAGVDHSAFDTTKLSESAVVATEKTIFVGVPVPIWV